MGSKPQKKQTEAIAAADYHLSLFGQQDKGVGRIPNSLTKAIAYERTPSLFDEEAIRNRDKNDLEDLQELKEFDAKFCIDRKDKPISLSVYQMRIIFALSYGLSQELESDDVKRKVKNPTKGDSIIRRSVNIASLSNFVFNSSRKRYKEKILQELFRLSRVRQIFMLDVDGRNFKFTSPLIMLGGTLEEQKEGEDISPEQCKDLDMVEVYFSSIFFQGLANRYAKFTPMLFEVWGKKGRGTELFSVLLSNLLSVYRNHKKAADDEERRVRKDNANKKLSKEELQEIVADARLYAMTYELNVTTIKQRVGTDYDSNRANKARFWKDLENAIDGFKELNLIEDYRKETGANGQAKVVFIFSENYATQKQERTSRFIEQKTGDGKPSAF